MAAVRLVLVALLATVGAVEALAAPAPLPKPRHGSDSAEFAWLNRELREHGILVGSLTQYGPNEWGVTVWECQGVVCGVDGPPKLRFRLAVRDRCAALSLLRTYYRARGLIP
jgi:hypothetical protein